MGDLVALSQARALQVSAAIRLQKEGPGFALPLFRNYFNLHEFFVQEIDEYLNVVSGFSAFIGDVSTAIKVDNGPVIHIGMPQIFVFITDDNLIHTGNVREIASVLRAFVSENVNRVALTLQIAELIGTAEEQRVARAQMRRVIHEGSGASAAKAFYEGSVVRATMWDRLVREAWNSRAAKRILQARNKISGYINPDSSIKFDLSALNETDYTNSANKIG
jgi:hypothetical protein